MAIRKEEDDDGGGPLQAPKVDVAGACDVPAPVLLDFRPLELAGAVPLDRIRRLDPLNGRGDR